jgi:putative flippase GtrA
MTQPSSADREVHPAHPPVVPIAQAPFVPRRRLQRLVDLFPPGQFARYICVGAFNTVFGYGIYVVLLASLNAVLPARWLSLTVVLASLLGAPPAITVAYFGYKFFVFRTRGNYLREWLKCCAVYGSSMLPGLVVLSALTRFLQSTIHSHGARLHEYLGALERHLSGSPLALLHRIATGNAMAGYIAGALVMGASSIYSFVGHKKITFRTKAAG